MNKESKTTRIKEFIFSSWAIEHRTVIYVIMSIFFILGISSYFSMPREAFPEINDTKVFVSTIYPGNTAEDIERIVTDPLEEALKGVSNLVEIRSTSSEDFAHRAITNSFKPSSCFITFLVCDKAGLLNSSNRQGIRIVVRRFLRPLLSLAKESSVTPYS